MTGEHASPPRFPWRVTALVALAVVVASVVTGLLLSRDRVDSAPAAPASGTPVATPLVPAGLDRQATVLLTVRDEERQAASSMLLGVGGTGDAVSELLLPRALLLPTSPPIRLAQASDPTGDTLAAAPLQTLLGVRVDAVVDLDRLAWTGLIDATGSRVDPVMGKQPGSFGLVVDRVLAGLPSDAGTTSELLLGLGSMARTTVTNEDAGRLLSLIGRGLRAQDSVREPLPVTYVRAGEDRAAVVDRAAAAEVVGRLFGQSVLEPGHNGPLRVVLQRAGATIGGQVAAQLALASAGVGVVVDPSEGEPVAATRVVVPDGSAAAQAAGEQVAAALGVPVSAVSVESGGGDAKPVVDVLVLLGPEAQVTGG